MATRNVALEKKVDMKFIEVDVLKNIARMTRRLCVLIMSHSHFITCSKQTQYLKFK